MKKTKMAAAGLATIGLVLTASPATAASASNAKSADVSCWSDISTGESLCVPLGDDLVGAVHEEYGISMIAETSPGISTNLVTGESFGTPGFPRN